ncbi:CHAT domain-containing protein [Mastigocoleus sp. MO_188.B34]|uniref:CHAT domain-containing protein n=1 Tax=Mastigocoleus sp. MO_188.B34 TaxID=3036635 RepID=UPI0026361BFD|nr:CHAT domain-containing protein [Mastigocoleus sp. MO_188.B34]MDJ0693039.1 CHAT domain-containing protein [Mastigocoleus sp. MO_188.B34]
MSSSSPIKILFLAADPSDESRLRLGQEIRDIKERLRIAKEADKYQLEQRESVRVGDITQAIFDFEPQIIHFSGHGTNQGELCFEDELGTAKPVEAEALAAMFELLESQVKCVILNACYSEIQAQAIAKHIPFAIGMNDAIGDKAAIAFAVGFYKALGANRSIEDACKFGCVEIRLQGIPEHLKPVIYKREITPTPTPTPTPKNNPFVPLTGIVKDPNKFFGRKREISWIFETLNSGSSVALIGKREIGKSSLLWAIQQQAEAKLTPPRKPIYLDMSQVYDEEDFYFALCDEMGIEECKGFRLNRTLAKQRLRFLLLLDEIEKMTWEGFTNQVRGQLRGLANGRDAPLRLVVAASTSLDRLFPDSHELGMVSPFQNICLEEEIELWNEATVRDFISDRLVNNPIRFTESEITQIIESCGGHPKDIMQMCYRTYAAKFPIIIE